MDELSSTDGNIARGGVRDEVVTRDASLEVENAEVSGEANPAESEESESSESADSQNGVLEAINSEELQLLAQSRTLALIESVLFAFADPIELSRLVAVTGLQEEQVTEAIDGLKAKYLDQSFGFDLVMVAGKYQLRTKAEFSPFLQRLKSSKPKKLSAAALETLAIIAYRQPIVKSDVEAIRGVDATPTIKTLLERGIIKIVGHKATIGQPALYGTTDRFLSIFGLQSLAELPTLRDLKELEEDPGEVAEIEPEEVEVQGPHQSHANSEMVN